MVLEKLLTDNKTFVNSKGEKVTPVPYGRPVVVFAVIKDGMGRVLETVEEKVERLLVPQGANAYAVGEAAEKDNLRYYPVQFYKVD